MARDKEKQRVIMANWYAKNRDRVRASQKAWRNSERGAVHRFSRTLRRHGITQAKWDAMWREQSGSCAGCLRSLRVGADTHIDHCHSTNAVRGLLCASCNLAIGKLDDSPGTLRRLADYLDRHTQKAEE